MELVANEVSSGNNKSPEAEPSRGAAAAGKVVSTVVDSALKRAIKENENSIIQSILGPSSVRPSSKEKSSNVPQEKSEGGLFELLLDQLFEDGQLTRIEYDIVDKGIGAESASQQVQLLLRILTNEKKDDSALELLLEYLCTQDPISETLRKLSSQSNPGGSCEKKLHGIHHENRHKHYQHLLANAIQAAQTYHSFPTNHIFNASAMIKADNNGGMDDNDDDDHDTRGDPLKCKGGSFHSTPQNYHDFYYGRPQSQRGIVRDKQRKWEQQQMMNKTRTAPSSAPATNLITAKESTKELTSEDLRDFYLSDGCLETIRNLILDSDASNLESLTGSGWERVLRNMNGLLSTDVVSIKDLLFQLKCLEIHREQELAEVGRRIILGKENVCKNGNSTDIDEENLMDFQVNWSQIIYHSFAMWKQRNGSLATFFSLVGVFQHSQLFRTSDLLLQNKLEIQQRENEKHNGGLNEGGGGGSLTENNNNSVTSSARRRSSTSTQTTMLEKSDFLRKFYIPSRKSTGGTPPTPPPPLSTATDRVAVSPVLSLDLL